MTTTADTRCDVNWGSHACQFPRGHEGAHECSCCECPDHEATQGVAYDEDGEYVCVAKPPYYGPDTQFHGKDAEPADTPT